MKVTLFVTCLVDQLCPQVGMATVDVLERAGCSVTFDEQQTCCGQPAFNSGDRGTTRAIAEQVIERFAEYDYVVVNQELRRAFGGIRAILHAERLKRERQTSLSAFVRGMQSKL